MTDEPLLESTGSKQASANAAARQDDLRDLIERLTLEQPYAVLCTQGKGQPYGSLVALAVTDDLSSAVFATPMTTRKYRLLCDCDHVALVIDSRSQSVDDMMQIEAVTATGRAKQLSPGTEFEQMARLLVGRHPQLDVFVRSPSTAIFRVEIIRYFHVSRFQEVRQWIPTRG